MLLEWLKNTTEQDIFLRRRGFDAAFIARANDVTNDDLWFPTRDDLLAAHVLTAIR